MSPGTCRRPTHRWTAVGQVAVVVREGEAAASRAGGRACGRRRSASIGRGSDDDAGVEQVVRVEQVLERRRTGAIASAEYMIGRSSPRARPSPCSPESEPPCDATSRAASVMKRAEDADAGARLERHVDADVDAAVAEVAVRQAVEAVLGEERVELAQVGAEPLGRHGRVLPARPRLRARRRAPGQARAVGPDLPQRRGLGAGRQRRVWRRVPGVGDDRARAGEGVLARRRRPPRRRASRRPAGRAGTASAPLCRRTTSTSRASMPSIASGGAGEEGGDGVGRRRHVRVAEHDQHRRGGERRPGRRSRRAPSPACPRCRPAPSRGPCRSRGAGARGSSRRPGGRTGPARCGCSAEVSR